MKGHIEQERIKRLVKWARGEPQPPIRIDLEPTFGCNLKCKFCWQRDPYRKEQCNYSAALSDKRLIQLVEEAAELGVLEWQLAGGWEPMIKPELSMNLMRLIKKHGMFGCLTTNGTLFREEWIKELVEVGWDQILFSLESSDRETHDFLTGVKGSYEKSVGAMRLFRDWKKKLKTKSPRFSFHTVITNRNYHQLSDLVKIGGELGVEGIGFESLNVWSKEGGKLKLTDEQNKEFLEHVREAVVIARKLDVPTTLDKFIKDKRLVDKEHMDEVISSDITELEKTVEKETEINNFITTSCFEPFTSIEIRASGHVVECRLCDYQDYAPRLHYSSLRDIWYGSYFEKIRKEFIDGDLPGYCKTCAAGIVDDMRRIREEMMLVEKSPLAKMKHRISKKMKRAT